MHTKKFKHISLGFQQVHLHRIDFNILILTYPQQTHHSNVLNEHHSHKTNIPSQLFTDLLTIFVAFHFLEAIQLLYLQLIFTLSEIVSGIQVTEHPGRPDR